MRTTTTTDCSRVDSDQLYSPVLTDAVCLVERTALTCALERMSLVGRRRQRPHDIRAQAYRGVAHAQCFGNAS